MAKSKIIRFPDVAKPDRPRWLRNDRDGWTVKFRTGARPSLAKAAKAAKASGAAQVATAPAGPDDDEVKDLTPSIPHYWDLMVMREVLDFPDSPRTYATKDDRRVAETKAMAAQRRVMENFANKYIEKDKKCRQLEAENRKLREQLSSSTSPSASRRS